MEVPCELLSAKEQESDIISQVCREVLVEEVDEDSFCVIKADEVNDVETSTAQH